jgi:predicted nucleic acid-binding protein
LNALGGPIYLDASAWLKLYLPEGDSDALNEDLAGHLDVVVGSVRRGMIAAVRTGRFTLAELTPAVHRRAEEMREPRLRAADALHVALALSVRAALMVSYDRRLRAAAEAHGLALYPPAARLA